MGEEVGQGLGQAGALLGALSTRHVRVACSLTPSAPPPGSAQVIYATTPLFATACAIMVLNAGDESMGSIGWAGAACMLTAAIVASISGTNPGQDCPAEPSETRASDSERTLP